MATASQIFQSGVSGDNRLFYQQNGQFQQIANPTQLQDLAKQGVVQVGGTRGVLPSDVLAQFNPTQPSPTSSTPVTVNSGTGAINNTATAGVGANQTTTGSLEARPGVYNSSSLVDFYQNQISRMRPQFDQSQQQLADINKQIAGLYQTPSLSQQFREQSQAATSSIDATLAQRTDELNSLTQSLANIEGDVRSRVGGQAPESYIQALISKESAPLVNRAQALQQNISLLQDQRNAALQSARQSIDLAEADRQRQLNLLGVQQGIAQQTLESFNTLIEKGAAASQQEQERAQQLFSSFLEQDPSFLSSLSQDEVNQLQRGILPFSAVQKLGDKIASTPKPTKGEIIGSAEMGYFRVDPFTGQTEQLIAPRPAGSSVTESDVLSYAKFIYDSNPELTPDGAIAQARIALSGGGIPSVRGADTQTPQQPALSYEEYVQRKNPALATLYKLQPNLDQSKTRAEYEAYTLATQSNKPVSNTVSAFGRRKDDKYSAQVDKLRDDYSANPVVKDYLTQRSGYQQSQIIDPETADPQEDIALIFSFMKVLDPNSVVREGEFDTAKKYTSTLDGLGVKLDQVMKGSLLSVTQRKNIRDAIEKRFGLSRKNYDQVVSEFSRQAQSKKVDPEDFIIDYSSGPSNANEIVSWAQGFNNVPSKTLNGSIGSLSARYESQGNPGAIGYDSTGGLSYGAYQLAHNNALKFIQQSPYAKDFTGIPFNSQKFQQKWKEIAARDPQGFLQAQHNYIQKTHFDPQAQKLQSEGINVSSLPQIVKDVIWSTAVQHGPANDIIKQAFKMTKTGKIADLITNIYNLRWAGGRNFARSTPEVKKAVYNRFFGPQGELNAALAAVRGNQTIA